MPGFNEVAAGVKEGLEGERTVLLPLPFIPSSLLANASLSAKITRNNKKRNNKNNKMRNDVEIAVSVNHSLLCLKKQEEENEDE